MACSTAVEILNEMIPETMVVELVGKALLNKLAELLLCQKYHQYQKAEKVQEWASKIHESAQEFLAWKETRAENKSLQKEKKKLAERVTLLEQDLAKESEKASQAMKKVRSLKNLATVPADQLADLQGEHAALKEKFMILQKDHAEYKPANELWSHKFGKAEEEAQKREAELKSELFEAKRKAQEAQEARKRETELSKKLSEAEREAQKKETKLKKLLKTEQKARENIEKLSNKLLQAEQRAQEAQDTGAELSNRLSQMEQEAQIREAEITQKLTDTENSSKQIQENYHTLQLKFEELSTKDEVRRIEMEAQRSMIFLLQTELKSQRSKLKENKHIQDHEESQTVIQEETSISDGENDRAPAMRFGPDLGKIAAQVKGQQVTFLTRFEALDSLARYFCLFKVGMQRV